MSKTSKRYSPEFKREAVKLAQEKGVYYTHDELGVSTKSLYDWLEKTEFNSSSATSNEKLLKQLKAQAKEISRLKEEREILKKAAIYFASEEKK
jgi:transposase